MLNISWNDPEPLVAAKFFALAHEQLRSQTDAQQRTPTRGIGSQRGDEPTLMQPGHPFAKCSDSWQNQAPRALQILSSFHHLHFRAEVQESICGAMQIAHAIINNSRLWFH